MIFLLAVLSSGLACLPLRLVLLGCRSLGTWCRCNLHQTCLLFGVKMRSLVNCDSVTLFPSYMRNRLVQHSVLLAFMQQGSSINKPHWYKVIPNFLSVSRFAGEPISSCPRHTQISACVFVKVKEVAARQSIWKEQKTRILGMSQQRFRLLGSRSTSGESPVTSHCHELMGGIKKHRITASCERW